MTSESYNDALLDSDDDLIPDVYDAFPYDETRSFKNTIPNDTVLTIAFEDNFPNLGDGDYNDLLAYYQVVQIKNNENNITDILGFSEAIAKIAGYNHRFGLRINFI